MSTWLDVARRVVENKQYEVVNPDTCEPVETEWVVDESDGEPSEQLKAKNNDGVLVDGFTAQYMLAVHEALGDEGKAKFEAMPLLKAVDVTWKLVNR